MWINLFTITWSRYLVSLIPWNLTLYQRHFHWLFSSFSMWSSFQMDDIELRTSILPVCDLLRLKSWWYFEGELKNGSAMSKNYLINYEQNYWEIKFGEGDLSITNEYQRENSSMKINYRYMSLSLCIYMYTNVPR